MARTHTRSARAAIHLVVEGVLICRAHSRRLRPRRIHLRLALRLSLELLALFPIRHVESVPPLPPKSRFGPQPGLLRLARIFSIPLALANRRKLQP